MLARTQTQPRTKTDLAILRIFHDVQYGDYLRTHSESQWSERCTTGDLSKHFCRKDGTRYPINWQRHCAFTFKEGVPDYIIEVIAHLRGIENPQFSSSMRKLETLADIRFVKQDDWFGNWYTTDGHTIEVTHEHKDIIPVDPPFHAIIKLDGYEILKRQQFRTETAKFFRIEAQGITQLDFDDSSAATAGKYAVPLFGDDVVETVNKLLENFPEWNWKTTWKWLKKSKVPLYDRGGWRQQFGSEPPSRRGNAAIVNEADLMNAIRAEQEINNRAFDQIDSIDKRKQSIRRK